MKPTPNGWPRASSSFYYDDPRSAIGWLQQAFDFQLRTLVDGPDGGVQHSELTFGDAVFMVSGPSGHHASPRSLGGKNTQSQFVYVDDVDAHFERATACGAEIDRPLSDVDYGEGYWADRGYGCIDPGGHHWYFATRLRG